jgi:hypothetical protein
MAETVVDQLKWSKSISRAPVGVARDLLLQQMVLGAMVTRPSLARAVARCVIPPCPPTNACGALAVIGYPR